MTNKVIGYYSVIIGVSVIAMWVFILLNESLPEGKTELTFHLFSEFMMAFCCLISGLFLLKKKLNGKLLNVLGLGMMIYSVLNAAGYYGERGDIPMMILFFGIFILTLAAVFFHLKKKSV